MFSPNLPPISPDIGLVFLAQAALMAGIAGSIHCTGMCGGLVIATTKTAKDHLHYQAGRLMAYLLLAYLIGLSSKAVNEYFPPLAYQVMGIVLGIFLVTMGIMAIKKKSFHLPSFFPQFVHRFFIKMPRTPFYVGLSTFLLPCGLLYSVLASLLLVESPYKAMFAISFFWLGALPALTIVPGTLKKGLMKIGITAESVYGILFIIMGLTNIGLKLYPLFSQNSAALQCH